MSLMIAKAEKRFVYLLSFFPFSSSSRRTDFHRFVPFLSALSSRVWGRNIVTEPPKVQHGVSFSAAAKAKALAEEEEDAANKTVDVEAEAEAEGEEVVAA